MTTAAPAITALAPWFGNNRTKASLPGRELGKLAWCGVPFVGGAPELPFILTRAGVATDLHRHIINLARVIRDERLKIELVARLDVLLFHPDELAGAQKRCLAREVDSSPLFGVAPPPIEKPDVNWAADYFVCCWMGLGGHAGKQTEFGQGLSLRYTSSGGDSAKRFRSAIESLEYWHRALRVWSFDCIDAFAMLERVQDEEGHGLYVDAPWPDLGTEYRHAFDDRKQERLARTLGGFTSTRIVVRFNDHPVIRRLYPADRWTWIEHSTRNQRNNDLREVLLINGPSIAPAPKEDAAP